ncbi:MAG: hypothetical protein ACM3KR_10355 [Deltaproteobacteria bacterium]
MTAEIGILNKSAVALAADSAVTIRTAEGYKIYNTANKLFSLSKYHPVGIMIYGNSELMGIPWETIIKSYRCEANEKSFEHISNYAEDFINNLEHNHYLFDEGVQKSYFNNTVFNYLSDMKRKVEYLLKTNDDLSVVLNAVISSEYEELIEAEYLPFYPENYKHIIITKYAEELKKIITNLFNNIDMNEDYIKAIINLCGEIFIKNKFSSNYSGVVIAGFGSKDIFPSLINYKMEGILNNKLKCIQVQREDITFSNPGSIIPFAQDDMVHNFMEGIDERLETQINRVIIREFTNLYNEMSSLSNNIIINNESKNNYLMSFRDILEKKLTKITEDITNYKFKNFVQPVMEIVTVLPKDEMAAMAESLVNLTSLKRKVSTSSETVGGPIDVAIISKGDGFIWIKRKHYFNPEFNHSFFDNYYKYNSSTNLGER